MNGKSLKASRAIATLGLAGALSVICLSPSSAAASAGEWGAREVNASGAQAASAFPGTRAFWAGACDLHSAATEVSDVAPPAEPRDCVDFGKWANKFELDAGASLAEWLVPPSWRLAAVTQAAAHPDASAHFTFERDTVGAALPAENAKNVNVDLPKGVVGNPGAVAKCSAEEFAQSPVQCPPESQVGVSILRLVAGISPIPGQGIYPIYNLEPRPGYIAEFGIPDVGTSSNGEDEGKSGKQASGTSVRIWARARTESDLGVTSGVFQIPTSYPLIAQAATFWGVPWAASHDRWRVLSGGVAGNTSCGASDGIDDSTGDIYPGYSIPIGGLSAACQVHYSPSWGPIKPFFSLQTSCGGSTTSRLAIDSYQHPGGWANPEERLAFRVPDFTNPNWLIYDSISPPTTGCEDIEWNPSLSLTPTDHKADSPTGLDVELKTPQHNEAPAELQNNPDDDTGAPAYFKTLAGLATSHLKDTEVHLPQGLSFSPSAAEGLEGCSTKQIGLTSALGKLPATFDNVPPSCPEGSKVGTILVQTELLGEPLPGIVYLAAQDDNPFNSTFGIYLVLRAPERNLIVKIAGSVEPDPKTGQITSVFLNSPELPFDSFQLHFKGGPRAPLASPSTCGTFSTESSLTGWSDPTNPVPLSSPYQVTSAPPGGCPTSKAARPFELGLSAGSANPVAGAHTPFSLRLTRADGNQELDSLSVSPPPGFVASLRGIPYCPEAQIAAAANRSSGKAEQANPSCPAASKVGTTLVGAGPGPNPLYAKGALYLAGPYKGAPLSMVAVTPALGGPYDFGVVVVRTALFLDSKTARITAKTDPIPKVFAGIPLRVRDVRIDLDRPDWAINPTSCEPMSVDVSAAGASGASASPSNPFRVGNCAALGFKPKLSLKLQGGTKRGGHPALTATLNAREGDANIGAVSVAIPRSEFLDQGHIRTICTRVQFAAHSCPVGSIYGYAKAWSPLLDNPLEGPVYLRSSNHNLPDMVADLNGQIEIEVAGRIDSFKGQIRNTFDVVPDAPVSKFVLTLKGARKGLLINSRDICANPGRAEVRMKAHNGRAHNFKPLLKAECGKKPNNAVRGN